MANGPFRGAQARELELRVGVGTHKAGGDKMHALSYFLFMLSCYTIHMFCLAKVYSEAGLELTRILTYISGPNS